MLYTRDTAVKFYCLLVGTPIFFATLLNHCQAASLNGKMQSIKAPVMVTGKLLHANLFSDAFDCHMKSLVDTEPRILFLLLDSHRADYYKFADENEIYCQQGGMQERKGESGLSWRKGKSGSFKEGIGNSAESFKESEKKAVSSKEEKKKSGLSEKEGSKKLEELASLSTGNNDDPTNDDETAMHLMMSLFLSQKCQ